MSELPRTMRGVWLTGHGDLDQLEFRSDIPVPRAGPRDVLIRVAAAGVNNTDIDTRIAWYSKKDGAGEDASWTGAPIRFPRIQGADVCGRIVAVGEEVSADRVGERVLIEPCIREANGRELERPWYFGSECDGGFAEYTVVAARHAYRVECADRPRARLVSLFLFHRREPLDPVSSRGRRSGSGHRRVGRGRFCCGSVGQGSGSTGHRRDQPIEVDGSAQPRRRADGRPR